MLPARVSWSAAPVDRPARMRERSLPARPRPARCGRCADPASASASSRRGRRFSARSNYSYHERTETLPDHSARILLVDDEQSIQTLLSYPLRKEGYDVVQATDGRQARDRFDEQVFDLVVLDLMLPKVDGLEVCRRLRSRSSV